MGLATDGWPNRTEPGGSRGLDDYMILDFHRNIGAEIMGRNKFGPQRGAWEDHEWSGWWGDDELLDRYHCDRVPSPSGVTHLLFWRR